MNREQPPVVKTLPTGYYFVKWSREVWAQWPTNRAPLPEDFFHNTSTPERIKAAAAAVGMRST